MTDHTENDNALQEVSSQLQSGHSMPAELLEVFNEEAEDHLISIYEGLGKLQENGANVEALADIRRATHTLKGAAGAVGLQAATRLSHRMEDLLDQLADQEQPVSRSQADLFLATADQLQGLTSGDFDVQTVARQIVELYDRYSQDTDAAPTPSTASEVEPADEFQSPANKTADDRLATSAKPTRLPSGHDQAQFLRVPVNRLDNLVGLLGEMMVNRSEFEHRLTEFESRIEDMQCAMERLRDVAHCSMPLAARESPTQPLVVDGRNRSSLRADSKAQNNRSESPDDFDELEFEQFSEGNLLAQTLSEAENDAEIMSEELRTVKVGFDALIRRQQQLNGEAQKSLMRIRLLPLSGIISRLERTVRTVSNKLGRDVTLNVVGEKIELDKTVLDEITDPLLHLIRNAIDHGVEPAETRRAAGKPESAQIRISAVNHGTRVTLQVADDGAGINLENVRKKATQLQLIQPGQQLSDDELYALIFRPGFSTARELTDVSGRGVGMDVVGESIQRLKGSISVESQPGVGTTFSIHLPTNLSITRALMVESGGDSFAIPMQSIQKIQNLDPATVTEVNNQFKVILGDEEMRLFDLAVHLNLKKAKSTDFHQASPMLLLGGDHDNVAITVDSILGSRDIVVKSLGNHLKKVNGFVGATIAGDGSVIPILDTADLVRHNRTNLLSVAGLDLPASTVRQKLAIVVDDSISVRRVTGNLLTSAGWDVVTAKDGVDALEILAEQEKIPDVFLCDMEMPRMNGLELVRQIRDQTEFELLPIVMVTSRASEKHRNKAFDAGVNDYVVKPFNDEQLLALISGLVLSARETVCAT